MSTQSQWDKIYRTKSPSETSWYAQHLQTSLDWIYEAAPDRSTSIIDVGGGESTLVDDLVEAGYRDVTVLDLAAAAIEKTRARLGVPGDRVHWIAGDVAKVPLAARSFALWHDRAVFHFLIAHEQRTAYVRQLKASLKEGGHAVMATFGPDGPEKCSGFPVRRYSAGLLQEELGEGFELEKSMMVDHQTPVGAKQQFLYCRFLFR